MFGFLVRLTGCLILAAGTVFAIGDIARSLSADALRLTTLAEAAALLPAESGASAPFGAESLWAAIAPWPVSPTLAALAFLLLLLGRRRRSERIGV